MARRGRKRKQTPSLPQVAAAFDVPERVLAQGPYQLEAETANRPPTRVRRLTTLDMVYKNGGLSDREYYAGEQFFADAYLANKIPSHAMDYGKERVDSSISDWTPEYRLDAETRYRRAARALGPLTVGTVHSIVLHGQTLKQTAQLPVYVRCSQKQREAQVVMVLKIGLDGIANSYEGAR